MGGKYQGIFLCVMNVTGKRLVKVRELRQKVFLRTCIYKNGKSKKINQVFFKEH